MDIISFQNQIQYKLLEFCYYTDDEHINVVEMLLDTDNIDLIEQNLSDTFIIDIDGNTFVCSGYNLYEYYPTGNGIKVVCIK